MIPFPDKKYDIIYADPPWDCEARAFSRCEMLSAYYPTMPLEDITSLPVNNISEKDAYLYLWTIDNMLTECLAVCKDGILNTKNPLYGTNKTWVWVCTIGVNMNNY